MDIFIILLLNWGLKRLSNQLKTTYESGGGRVHQADGRAEIFTYNAIWCYILVYSFFSLPEQVSFILQTPNLCFMHT